MNSMFQHIDKIVSTPTEVVNKKLLPLIKGGGYCLLNGRGGLGKSMIAMRSLVHFLDEYPQQKAVAIFSEDDKDEVNKRLYTVCRNEFNYADDKIKQLKDRVRFKTVDNQETLKFTEKQMGETKLSSQLYDFSKYVIKYNIGFIVIDPLKAFHNIEENDNSQMDILMRGGFQYLGSVTNAVVLVLHHSSKSSNGARGASTIEDSSRISYNISRIMKKGAGGVIEPDEDFNGLVKVTVGKDTKGLFRDCNCLDKNGHISVFPSAIEVSYQDKQGIYTSKPNATETSYQMPISENQFNANPSLRISYIIAEDDYQATSGFKHTQIDFNGLLDFISQANIHYSATEWKDGYRKGDNYIGNEDLIIFDIDDGMSLKTARQYFSQFNALIVTTKSHQKNKNGIVCDRFRVLIPYENPLVNVPKEYIRDIKKLIYAEFKADEQTSNLASKFRGASMDAEYYFLGGEENFKWEKYYQIVKIEFEKKRYESESKRLAGNDFSELGQDDKIKALQTRFNNLYTDGARNSTVADVLMFGKSMNLDFSTIETVVEGLVSASGSPLADKEMMGLFKYHLK